MLCTPQDPIPARTVERSRLCAQTCATRKPFESCSRDREMLILTRNLCRGPLLAAARCTSSPQCHGNHLPQAYASCTMLRLPCNHPDGLPVAFVAAVHPSSCDLPAATLSRCLSVGCVHMFLCSSLSLTLSLSHSLSLSLLPCVSVCARGRPLGVCKKKYIYIYIYIHLYICTYIHIYILYIYI